MFLNAGVSVLSTDPATSVRGFARQRMRWAGKWEHNTSTVTRLIAVYVLVVQLAILASFIVGPVFGSIVIASVLAMRLIMEAWFLYQVKKFLGIRWNMTAFLVLQVLYPIYVIIIGVSSRFVPYSWKGRSGQSLS